MNLTSQLKNTHSELSRRLQPFRPKSRPDRNRALLAPPRSKRYSMVAMAFDYLLRFELERLAPHAATRRWTAEAAPDLISYPSAAGTVAGLGVRVADSDEPQSSDLPRLADQARAVIARAKESVYEYVAETTPDPNLRRIVAKHAVRLARLDPVVKTGHLDRDFGTAPADDVDDVLRMLEVSPVAELVHPATLVLDPALGESAMAVGGTEVGLISGDLLVDTRVASRSAVQPVLLDQLLAHVLLCRTERRRNPQLPDLRWAGLLFPRQGYLWTIEVSEWTAQAGFDDMERWFQAYLEGRQEPTKVRQIVSRKPGRVEKWLKIDRLRKAWRNTTVRHLAWKPAGRKALVVLYFVILAIVVLLALMPK